MKVKLIKEVRPWRLSEGTKNLTLNRVYDAYPIAQGVDGTIYFLIYDDAGEWVKYEPELFVPYVQEEIGWSKER